MHPGRGTAPDLFHRVDHGGKGGASASCSQPPAAPQRQTTNFTSQFAAPPTEGDDLVSSPQFPLRLTTFDARKLLHCPAKEERRDREGWGKVIEMLWKGNSRNCFSFNIYC